MLKNKALFSIFMVNQLILPACYLPPVSYFHVVQQHDLPILLEKYEHYPKQTYRTRTSIATANGKLDLVVPIVHGRKDHVAMKDIRINYEYDWQRLHWLSIQTAYRSSAYFEFYEDDFARFYTQKHDFLFDFNQEQLVLLLKLFKISRPIVETTNYQKAYPDGMDFRPSFLPKNKTLLQNPKPYYQVFEARTGFMPNMSSIDLLFNQGPQARNFL